MCRAITTLPHYIFKALCVVLSQKHTDNFTFTFTYLTLSTALTLFILVPSGLVKRCRIPLWKHGQPNSAI